MLQLRYSLLSHPGRKRQHNEDFVASFDPDNQDDLQRSGRLFILADGVGGASKGERASQYAAQKVLFEYYRTPEKPPEERLSDLIRQVGNEIYMFAQESEVFMRMASTMVAAVVRNDRLTVANVGDSRLYLVRDGVVNQITKDHSWVAEMVRDGVMTEQEAMQSKRKNRITRSIGGELNVKVDIFSNIPLQSGDRILICSDGFSQYADREQIGRMIAQRSPEEAASAMIEYANRSGGSDNISVIVIEVLGDLHEMPTIVGGARSLQAPRSLEEMGTEPGESVSGFSGFLRRSWFLLVVLFLISTVALSALYFLGGKRDGADQTGTSTESVSATEIDPVPTAIIDESPTATLTPTIPPTSTLPPTETPMPQTGESGQGILAQGDPIGTCSLVVPDGMDARQLAAQLGKTFNTDDEFISYSQGITCEQCDYDNQSAWYYVVPGWVMEYPEIEKAVCIQQGGSVIP